jgi:nucleoside phosphorylase
MLAAFRPRLIAMTGICGGVKKSSQQFCDVIVGRSAWNYEAGKFLVTDHALSKFVPKTNPLQASDKVTIPISELIANGAAMGHIRGKLGGVPGLKREFRASLGNYATGAAVVASAERLGEVGEIAQGADAVEMESYAVFEAARQAPCKPNVLIAKAVADFGDKKKNDEYQGPAARASALFVQTALELFGSRLLEE